MVGDQDGGSAKDVQGPAEAMEKESAQEGHQSSRCPTGRGASHVKAGLRGRPAGAPGKTGASAHAVVGVRVASAICRVLIGPALIVLPYPKSVVERAAYQTAAWTGAARRDLSTPSGGSSWPSAWIMSCFGIWRGVTTRRVGSSYENRGPGIQRVGLVSEGIQDVDDYEPKPLRGKRLCSVLVPLGIPDPRPPPRNLVGLSEDTGDAFTFLFIVRMKEETMIVLVELDGTHEPLASLSPQPHGLHSIPPPVFCTLRHPHMGGRRTPPTYHLGLICPQIGV